MTIGQFIRVCNSNKIKSARIFDNVSNDFWDVDKIVFSRKTKRFFFDDKDGKNQIEPIIGTKDIAEIVRVGTDDDNQYIFIMRLKDNREYTICFEMKYGYTPFLLRQEEIDNIKAVREAIPQHLDPLKGQRVKICKTQNSPIYGVCNDAGDLTSMCTERFVINDFDYTIDMVSGFPLIKLLDRNHEDCYSTAFAVRLIDGTKYNIDNGEYNTGDSVIISADSGNYFLTCVD